jgi:uncharacterized protein (DUF433 family)
VETLIKRYPSLGAAKVLGALAFAYDNVDAIEAEFAIERAEYKADKNPEISE